MNIRPIVKVGDKVIKDQVLCEGYATQNGELALGRNLKVHLCHGKGIILRTFIVLSERVAREDLFTSLHIEEHNVSVRETKRGAEELTPDIPNVSEEATKDLDEYGMIRVGSHVKPGNILIGKITPKGESDPTPEEKLLRAIFGEKAGDVKDASLKAKPSHVGVVIGKSLFSKTIKDRRVKAQDKQELESIDTEFDSDALKLKKVLVDKLYQLVAGKSSQGINNVLGEEVIAKSVKFTQKILMQVDFLSINPNKWTTNKHNNELIIKIIQSYIRKYNEIYGDYRRKRFVITIGDELPSGVLQLHSLYC